MNKVITNNQEKCDMALAALYQVIDPEIGLNIVDLGLVNQIDFDDSSKTIFASMTLTTRFCPMGDSIKSQAEQVMQLAFSKDRISIEVVFDPPWTPDRISEQGKNFLNR